jgi:hypothetical protein
MNAILTRVSRSALEIPHGGVEGILGMFQMQERSLQCTFFKTLLNYSVISVSAKLPRADCTIEGMHSGVLTVSENFRLFSDKIKN